MYKRILLKLSGEQLQGKHDAGFDVERAEWIAKQLQETIASGAQIVVMVGGGNYARGAQLAGHGIGRVTADNIGMMATIMNAVALADVFNASNVPAKALTVVRADQVADQFTHRRALSHLEKGRVVIVAGGTGRPYVTTDTAAIALALEMDCEVVIKTTKVDGVYDQDPNAFADAKKYDTLTYEEALSNSSIKVMDKAALGLAMEQKKPVIICDLLTDKNILRATAGEPVGTVIS